MTRIEARTAERLESASARVVARVYSVDDRDYGYDASTNEIVELTSIEALILSGRIDSVDDSSIRNQIEAQFSGIDGMAAIQDFDAQCQSHGVFLKVPLRGIRAAPSIDVIREHLEHHISILVLGVTERCNLRCKYCPYSGSFPQNRGHSEREMPFETGALAVDFYLERADADAAPSFSFYGGEPFTSFRTVARLAEYIKKRLGSREYSLHITTNGTMLSRAEVRRFVAENAVSLTVSLDGPPEIHDLWRVTAGGAPTHQAVIKGLNALHSEYPEYYRCHVQFNAVISPGSTFSKVANYFTSLPLFGFSTRTVRLSGVDLRGSAAGRDQLAKQAMIETECDRCKVRSDFIRNRSTTPEVIDGLDSVFEQDLARIALRVRGPLPPEITPSGYCIPGGRKLFVSSSGEFGVCEKIGIGLPIGDVWQGFDFKAVAGILDELVAMWKSSCSFCHAQRFCSICPALVRGSDGGLSYGEFRSACHQNRTTFDEVVPMFIKLCTENEAYLKKLQSIVMS